MASHSIATGNGCLTVDEPDESALLSLEAWPKQIVRAEKGGRELWAITMKDTRGELLGLRVGYGFYESEKDALEILQIQRLLLPSTLAEYLKYGFDGILLPCSYLTGESAGPFLTGYALFGRSFRHCTAGLNCEPIQGYEEDFGVGGTNMLLSFILAADTAWKARGLPSRTITDLDDEPRSTCGRVWPEFLISGERLFCLMKDVRDDDPTWSHLTGAGLTRICHLPAVLAALPGEMPA